jgi:uncharacterized protein YfdQ (DUF2303 family)
MTEETTTTLDDYHVPDIGSFNGAVDIVNTAIANAAAAAEPIPLGDFGSARVVPAGMAVVIEDVRDFEETPRRRKGHSNFVDAGSIVEYVSRYADGQTLAYATDPHGRGTKMLTSQTSLMTVIINDHPSDGAGCRDHTAGLVLRPTEEARRWGNAINNTLDQEMFLDLIVDGLGEIAEPPGAELRDLVSDLHAIRTSEVSSVVRTGGEGRIVVSENVKLHAGPGTDVSFPEQMSITFSPFVDCEDAVGLTVRIKPNARGSQVNFKLSCAGLDNALATIAYRVASGVGTALDREVMWTA